MENQVGKQMENERKCYLSYNHYSLYIYIYCNGHGFFVRDCIGTVLNYKRDPDVHS